MSIKDECCFCSEKLFSRGLCKNHYYQAYRLSKIKDPLDLAIDLMGYKNLSKQLKDRLRMLAKSKIAPIEKRLLQCVKN